MHKAMREWIRGPFGGWSGVRCHGAPYKSCIGAIERSSSRERLTEQLAESSNCKLSRIARELHVKADREIDEYDSLNADEEQIRDR